MKRIIFYIIVFVLTLSFHPSLGLAIPDKDKDDRSQLAEKWVFESGVQNKRFPESFELFKDGTGIMTLRGSYTKEKISITWNIKNKRIAFMNPLASGSFDYTISNSMITLTDDDNSNGYCRYITLAESRKKEEEALRAIGFIALAPGAMNWQAAKAFCSSKGGELPEIIGMDGTSVFLSGFGARGSSWPKGLPDGVYWTSTERRDFPDTPVQAVHNKAGAVDIALVPPDFPGRAVCVSPEVAKEAKKKAAEEEARKQAAEEEARKKEEEALRAIGFIALAPGLMNWADAKAWCQQQGGRLPRVHTSASLGNGFVDGFGAENWPSGLPEGYYWTGTQDPPARAWFVYAAPPHWTPRTDTTPPGPPSNVVRRMTTSLSEQIRVICVSDAEARKAEEVHKAKIEAAIKAEKARKAEAEDAFKAAGFIASDKTPMNWNDAQAFCRQKGGRLPLIGGMTKWDFRNPHYKDISIDGFGAQGAPWLSALPIGDRFWTGTVPIFNPGDAWQISYSYESGKVAFGISDQSYLANVLCVPPLTAHEAEEMRKAEEAAAARRIEEARKAEAALKASGLFIAVSDTTMNWNDAKTFCQQKGGRLPLIDGSGKLSFVPSSGVAIDAFGKRGDPWPSSLPRDSYWTGTEASEYPGRSRTVEEFNGKIDTPYGKQNSIHAVVCVSETSAASERPSATEPPEEAQKIAKSEASVPAPTSPVPASSPAQQSPAPALANASAEVAPAANTTPTAPTPAQPSSYPPLAATDGKPKAAAHPVRLENNTVELALQMLAPGKTLEAIRIDNLGGVSSLWRSDGKDKAAPLSVSQGGTSLSSGAQAMSLSLGEAETLLSLSLKDNGAFAGKATEFRVTVFFVGGERVMCMLKVR